MYIYIINLITKFTFYLQLIKLCIKLLFTKFYNNTTYSKIDA